MGDYRMEFYNSVTGVQFRLRWKSEEEFRAAQAFLLELLGPDNVIRPRTAQALPYYYLESEQQLNAVVTFIENIAHRRRRF